MNIKRLIPATIKPQLKTIKHILYRIFTGSKLVESSYQIYSIYEENANIFFGYYDVTPFSKDDKKILYIRTKGSGADICTLDLDSKEQSKIGQTNLWNWQQGCRLRWVKNNKSISFNDIRNNNYCNIWKDLSSGEEKLYPFPIYDLSFDENYAATLDFERLGLLRPGYGYRCQNIPIEKLSDLGFSIIDIENNKILKQFSLLELRNFLNSDTDLQYCYINHLSFSPYGKEILFFFIEIIGSYHKASLIVYNYEKDQLHLLDGENKASHYVWKDADTIICTSQSPDKKLGYYSYSIKQRTKTILADNIINIDGHPSIFNENGMITDTYPDLNGYQRLYRIQEFSNPKLETLAKIYSVPVNNVEKRTDLHPRLSHNEDIVCFDANSRGKRSLNILILNNTSSH